MIRNAELRRIITEAAARSNFEPAKLLAVVETESAGITFWTYKGWPVPSIRPEGHYFYRLLADEEREEAVSAGLAWPRYTPGRAPRTWTASWATFERMAEINRDVAIMSCSWGLGQVMGSDWRKLGFQSAEAYAKANYTLEGQVDIMVRYIDADNLRRALNQGGSSADSWRPFANGYNGQAYERLNYHGKIAANYRTYAAPKTGKAALRAENDAEAVKDIQRILASLGYYKGAIDGGAPSGGDTRKAIKAFQRDHGLNTDGVWGGLSARAAATELAEKAKKDSDKLVGIGTGTTGVSAAGEQLINQVTPLKDSGGVWLQAAIGVLIFIGIALVCYGIYKRFAVQKEDRDNAAFQEEKASIAETEEELSSEDELSSEVSLAGKGFEEVSEEDHPLLPSMEPAPKPLTRLEKLRRGKRKGRV